jgi:hypothetical protein
MRIVSGEDFVEFAVSSTSSVGITATTAAIGKGLELSSDYSISYEPNFSITNRTQPIEGREINPRGMGDLKGGDFRLNVGGLSIMNKS